MNIKPKINIIIPTKNRAKFLNYTLETCYQQSYTNLRIIVVDDNSQDGTCEVVQGWECRDRRIEYHKNTFGDGMRDNFECGLSLVEDGYVLALGSDDGLMPESISKLADKILNSGAELLTWEPPTFFYPEVNSGKPQLVISHKKKSEEIKSDTFLKRQAIDLNYTGDPYCPMFYVKGIASFELIKKIKDVSPNGRFYQSATPDGYSGIVLAGFSNTFHFSNEPYTIHGVSPSSQGFGYLANDELSKKNSEQFFNSASQTHMHAKLGGQAYSPLIALMTADFLYMASDLKGWLHEQPQIVPSNMLNKALIELSHGIYSDSRMPRELEILKAISKHLDHESCYEGLLSKISKKKSHLKFSKSGLNHYATFIDLSDTGINNVYAASIAAQAIIQFKTEFITFALLKRVGSSVAHYLGSKKKNKKMSHYARIS